MTAALVSVSAGQGYFLLRSDKTARIAANAADLSATYFDLTNLGRTAAYPIEVRWGWFVGDKLPDTPIYIHRKSLEIDTILTREAKVGVNVAGFEMLIEPGDTERIVRNKITLWLYCRVAYLDFMQTRHEADFCWKRLETFGGGKLLPDATPAYNRKT